MKRSRPIYRKWIDDNRQSLHVLKIFPDGSMIELCKEIDVFIEKITIGSTHKFHGINTDLFVKHKEVATKEEYMAVVKKAIKMIKQ